MMRDDPCRGCHYLAFSQGQPLVDETGEPIRFTSRAAALAYEADYRKAAPGR